MFLHALPYGNILLILRLTERETRDDLLYDNTMGNTGYCKGPDGTSSRVLYSTDIVSRPALFV